MFSQLINDGHSTIASNLSAIVNSDPPCSPSDQLTKIVTLGLQHETDRRSQSEQALNLNPVQQMLIGPGIGMLNDVYMTYICVLNLLLNLIRLGI